MRQLRGSRHGEPVDVLSIVDVTEGPLADGQVRLACKAVGLNFLDLMLCRGTYPSSPAPPFTPGVEVAGTVVEVTSTTSGLMGTEVIACPTLPDGALGERAVVNANLLARRPDDLPAIAAAVLPITYQTSWFCLERAALQQGETVLVLGGAGGVGTAAIQLSVARGASVIAVAGGPEKTALCRDQGASVTIDHRGDDVWDAVATATHGAGVDVVIDPVGGAGMRDALGSLAFEGRYVLVGTAGGNPPMIDPMGLVPSNTSIIGVSWGSVYPWRRADAVASAYQELFRLHARNAISPLISEVVPLSEVPTALRRLGDRATVGKLVAVPGSNEPAPSPRGETVHDG